MGKEADIYNLISRIASQQNGGVVDQEALDLIRILLINPLNSFTTNELGQTINNFGTLEVKKVEGNEGTSLEIGDRVVNSNLNNSVFLIYGEYIGGDPFELTSFDPNTSNFYNPNG